MTGLVTHPHTGLFLGIQFFVAAAYGIVIPIECNLEGKWITMATVKIPYWSPWCYSDIGNRERYDLE